MRPPERIFLLPKLEQYSSVYEKVLPILYHFDPERHIPIETDASGYALGGFLGQLTLDLCYSDHVTSENPNPDPKFYKSKGTCGLFLQKDDSCRDSI